MKFSFSQIYPVSSIEKAARHVYAVTKADSELPAAHPQRKEIDDRKAQYAQDFQATILNVFDKLLFPGMLQNEDILHAKAFSSRYTTLTSS